MVTLLGLMSLLLSSPGVPQPGAELEGQWIVTIIDNIAVMPETRVTLEFRGTRVTGTASCNSYQGTFTVSEQLLTTSSILTTMKACDGPRMSQERDFLALLRDVASFQIESDGRLVLVTKGGKRLTATRA